MPKKKNLEVDPETGEVVIDATAAMPPGIDSAEIRVPRGTRAVAVHLPTLSGFECEEIPAIERVARRLALDKAAAKDAKESADAAHEALLRLMHEHSITRYKNHGVEVILDTKEKATVQVVAP